MAQFPQPQRNVRAPRVRVPQAEPVTFVADNARIPGILQVLSITGGCARLDKRCNPGLLAEIKLKTLVGPVQGLVEILASPDDIGTGQPFRFVALSDTDHERLNRQVTRLVKQGHGERAFRPGF